MNKGKQTKGAETRKKEAVVVDRHAQNCTVCKHESKSVLEALYMRFEPVDGLATEFELTTDAIYRHIRYYELSRKRAADTERVLEAIIQKGSETLSMLSVVDLKLVVESVKELHKIRGKHKEPQKNPFDAARQTLSDIIRDTGLSEEKARAIVAKQFGIDESVLISQAIN